MINRREFILYMTGIVAVGCEGEESVRNYVPDPVPTPTPASSPYFDFFGRQRFLIFASYFDGIRAGSLQRDMDFLKGKGIDGVRIFLNFAFPDNKPFRFLFLPDGGWDAKRLMQLQTLLTVAAEREMVVDITASRRGIKGEGFQMSMGKYQMAWTNLAIHLKNMEFENYLLDIQNEHNLEHDDEAMMSESQAASIRNAMRAHLPDVPITASVVNVSPGNGAAIMRAEGMNVLAWHDPRVFGWFNNTGILATQCKEAVGKDVKVIFDEPPRAGWGDVVTSAGDYVVALNHAKNAQIAGWCFHNDASFSLSHSTFESRLRPIEREFLDEIQYVN